MSSVTRSPDSLAPARSIESTERVSRFAWFLTAAGLGVLSFGTYFWAAAIYCVIVPKFEEIFRDFGTPLPVATQWCIGVSRVLTGKGPDGTLTMLLIHGVLLSIIIVGYAAVRSQTGRARLAGVYLLLISAVMFFLSWLPVVPAMYVPLTDTINAMQNTPAGP